jgi:starvation-inducible DNA-binding protein
MAQIGITEKNRRAVADLLNTWLADEYVLFTKTRQAHWSVTGTSFMELHKFFQSQYELLDDFIDSIAERVRTLDFYPIGSLNDFLKMTHLLEKPQDTFIRQNVIQELLQDHEIIIRFLRTKIKEVDEKYKDAGTADFITGILQQHETMAWMLRAYTK